jgi:hypothetical protein
MTQLKGTAVTFFLLKASLGTLMSTVRNLTVTLEITTIGTQLEGRGGPI